MTFHIVTLFPESLDSYINSSIIGRAISDKKIKVKFYNPRDFTKDKHHRVDQRPYGGGPGMVIEALPVIKAIEQAIKNSKLKIKNKKESSILNLQSSILIVWLTPGGKQFNNEYAEKFSKKYSDIVIVCGRYEGIDERAFVAIKNLKPASPSGRLKIEKVSIGSYVLTGGELPALVILDTIARRIPGVLGKIESVEENRVASSKVYTRPEVFEYPPLRRAGKSKKYRVPKVLLSGHAKKIEEWKMKN